MKIKTSELTSTALDWAVAKCEGITEDSWYSYFIGEDPFEGPNYGYSTNWSQGGPIIEREHYSIGPIYCNGELDCFEAFNHESLEYDESGEYIDGSDHRQYGPTPLIAAMRAFVASKLGDEVDVPDELC